ncbi:MAG: hypothetical protein R3C15_14520 [Thermoleophilia bacterium]
MTRFRFVTNLRPRTVESFERSAYRPQAWLLSTHRATRETLRLGSPCASRDDLFADNGTKELIGVVRRRFDSRLEGLHAAIRELRRGLGDGRRVPNPSEVPATLRREASRVAGEVANEVEHELAAVPVEAVLSEQLRMNPTHLIAKEDFTTATLVSLGLEREITGWSVARYDRLNARTLEYWRAASADPRCAGRAVYATLSATDYATARSAAELAARAGVTHVALGFAAINLDRTVVDVFRLPHRRTLRAPGPRRYVRVAEIVLGIRDGYRRAGPRLHAFHGLGLGATAQYPILAATLDWYTHVSVDSTSPLHDAVNDLVFYDDASRGDRVSVLEAAQRILDGGSWSFASPFCRDLRSRFRHDPTAARRWWEAEGRPAITSDDLHPARPLGAALGVFATARGEETAGQVRGRVAHNHWVCDQLAGGVPSRGRRDWGRDELDELVATRSSHTRLGLMAASEVVRAAL